MKPPHGFAFTKAALSFLGDLPVKQRGRVQKAALGLQNNAHPKGSKKLVGVKTSNSESVWRIRAGVYRILYVVRTDAQNTEVIVLDIDHRKDIYR